MTARFSVEFDKKSAVIDRAYRNLPDNLRNQFAGNVR